MATYTVRDLDEKTKKMIHSYATEQDLNVAQAIHQLVSYGFEHIRHTRKAKKYNSFFELYNKIHFRGGKNLSAEHDKVAYDL